MIDVRFVIDLEVLLTKAMSALPQRGDFIVLHKETTETQYRVHAVSWYFGPDSKLRGGGDFVEVGLKPAKLVRKKRVA